MRMLIRLAILLNAMVYAGSLVGPQSAVAEDQIHWQSSPQQAAAQAANEHKLVLLHFTANWCGPCQTQKRFVFSNPTVAQAVHQSVVPVLVDIDINRALAGELGVKSIPFDVFLTPQGEVVSKRNSPTDSRNFIQMVSQLPAPQAAPKSGALAKLAELKRGSRIGRRFQRGNSAGRQIKLWGPDVFQQAGKKEREREWAQSGVASNVRRIGTQKTNEETGRRV